VVAPIFWYVLLGPAGLLGYKAINTLDSMIGHRNDRYLYFGRVAARLDDMANFLPARLAGGCLVAGAALVAGPKVGAKAWATMIRDASKHKSPNAGWQEAAMAGAVALKLAGPRRYGTELVADPYLGDGEEEASAQHIHLALKIFIAGCCVSAVILASLQAAL
jgi:adenosylcobinamide-phosphate synthase